MVAVLTRVLGAEAYRATAELTLNLRPILLRSCLKKRQRDCGGLSGVACAVRVEVVSRVQVRQHESWVGGIGEGLVEVG